MFPQDQMTYIVEKLFGEYMKLDHSDSGICDIIISYDKKKKAVYNSKGYRFIFLLSEGYGHC